VRSACLCASFTAINLLAGCSAGGVAPVPNAASQPATPARALASPYVYVGAIDGPDALFYANPFPTNPATVTYDLSGKCGNLTALRTITGARAILVHPLARTASPK
jgi:hypothetical protein